MKMKSIIKGGLALAMAAALPLAVQAGIVGTKHDFSLASWNTDTTFATEICVVCHVPHNGIGTTDPNNPGVGLIWNREVTDPAGFTPYTSPTFLAVAGQPDGASLLCLSCHDGTIAVDKYGRMGVDPITSGVSPSYLITGRKLLGTNLTDDHPVSFTFNTALANQVGTLKDPSVALSGLGGTIQDDMLRNDKVQCVSCHNPHNPANNARFLVKSNDTSALCLTCHAFD